MVNADSGIQELLPSQRRVGYEQSAILKERRLLFLSPQLLRQDGRNQVLQRSYCTWVPHAIAHYLKNRTLHTVRQQKQALRPVFSSSGHPVGLSYLGSYRLDAKNSLKYQGTGKNNQPHSPLACPRLETPRYTRRMDHLWTPWRYSYITRADPETRSGVPAALRDRRAHV